MEWKALAIDYDLNLFEVAGLRVAVGNAIGMLKDHADLVMQQANGKGVAEFIHDHLPQLLAQP